jgi:hypothetical protein
MLRVAVLVALLSIVQSGFRRVEDRYGNKEGVQEASEVDLDSLDTRDSDPKVRLENLIEHYFQKHENPNHKISRSRLKELLVEFYFEMDPNEVKHIKVDYLSENKSLVKEET